MKILYHKIYQQIFQITWDCGDHFCERNGTCIERANGVLGCICPPGSKGKKCEKGLIKFKTLGTLFMFYTFSSNIANIISELVGFDFDFR